MRMPAGSVVGSGWVLVVMLTSVIIFTENMLLVAISSDECNALERLGLPMTFVSSTIGALEVCLLLLIKYL